MKVRSSDELGAVVRDRRRGLRLSQADLAARAGVTRQWVVRFEKGTSDVSLSKTFAVLDALDLNVRVNEPSERSASGRRGTQFTLSIPPIQVPQLTLPNIDWADISRRLAIQSMDMSTTLAEIRSKYPQRHVESSTGEAEHSG
ncbi:helix-turn-helix domain-containing protein [Pseudolysinimonas sp.]|uniref:helix-turn-helix domain-containing protein n=1 Tax=Pseudolysinimonas sp. TaxID=2680009 RepID=UPI003784AE4A